MPPLTATSITVNKYMYTETKEAYFFHELFQTYKIHISLTSRTSTGCTTNVQFPGRLEISRRTSYFLYITILKAEYRRNYRHWYTQFDRVNIWDIIRHRQLNRSNTGDCKGKKRMGRKADPVLLWWNILQQVLHWPEDPYCRLWVLPICKNTISVFKF